MRNASLSASGGVYSVAFIPWRLFRIRGRQVPCLKEKQSTKPAAGATDTAPWSGLRQVVHDPAEHPAPGLLPPGRDLHFDRARPK
jgi:hypothetical protein